MTDQPLTPPADTSAAPTSASSPVNPTDPKQDPLAVLQDILAQAKNKQGVSTPGQSTPPPLSTNATDELVAPPAEPAVDPAIEAAKLAEVKAAEEAENLRKQHELEAQIAAQRATIVQEMKTSTQEQARLDQKKEDDSAGHTGIANDPGFAINQIDHDKASI